MGFSRIAVAAIVVQVILSVLERQTKKEIVDG